MNMEANRASSRPGKPEKGSKQVTGTAAARAPAPGAATAAPALADTPWILRVWARLRREPSMLLTLAYVLVSFIGLWANFWFYRGFGLPILEYMQPSDYLVAGLRDPFYGVLLLGSTAFAFLISWPDTLRRRQPARVAAFRQRWWGPLLFPDSRWLRWKAFGILPETGIAFAVFWGMVWASASYVQVRGQAIREGREGVLVHVARADASLPSREARLLGTSGEFVFVWWPDLRVAEAVPIEALAGLRMIRSGAVASGHAPVAADAGQAPMKPAAPSERVQITPSAPPSQASPARSTPSNGAP